MEDLTIPSFTQLGFYWIPGQSIQLYKLNIHKNYVRKWPLQYDGSPEEVISKKE